jgi:hypothetical protein
MKDLAGRGWVEAEGPSTEDPVPFVMLSSTCPPTPSLQAVASFCIETLGSFYRL